MNSAAPYLNLVGRVLLSIMFIQSGVGKIFGYAGAQAMMEQHGVSGALLPLVILTEAGGGLLVLLGLFTPTLQSPLLVSACSPPGSSTISPATWAR